MKEQITLFKTAKLAKEKHFFYHVPFYYNTENPLGSEKDRTELCRHWMNEEMEYKKYTVTDDESGLLQYQINTYVNAPTQALLQRWLREVHKIDVISLPWKDHQEDVNDEHKYRPMIHKVKTFEEYPTYEEALEKGLEEALKLIKL